MPAVCLRFIVSLLSWLIGAFNPNAVLDFSQVGITTWQFRSTPLLTAAVSCTTLQRILPELRDHQRAQLPWLGFEDRLGPARLSTGGLGLAGSGARVWWPVRSLWWLDEVVAIGSKPAKDVAEVLEAVQEAAVGSKVTVHVKRLGYAKSVELQVRCLPSHRRAKRLLHMAFRGLVMLQASLSMHDFVEKVRKEFRMLCYSLEQMQSCGFFKDSQKDNFKQLILAVSGYLLKADAMKNLCLPPSYPSKCVAAAGAKRKTWKKVKLFDICRLKCNAESVDVSFCCMHVAKTGSCQAIWPSNRTEATDLADRITSAICEPLPIISLYKELRLLIALAFSVLRD